MIRRLIVLGSIALAGCSAPPQRVYVGPVRPVAPTVTVHPWGKPIVFGGMEFDFQVAGHHPYITNWLNQVTHASSNFVVVGVVLTNRTSTPVLHHLMPVFKLVDENKAVYEADQQHTITLNMRKPGRINFGQALNPNVPTKLEMVFEAPKQAYKLAVLVPDVARVGFAGAINTVGPFFMLDLSQPLSQ